MENIKQLLELNIEIEGLLRVAECRKSDTVLSLLLAKSKKFYEILNEDIAYDRSHDASIVIQAVPDPKTEMDAILEDKVTAVTDNETDSDLQETGKHNDFNETTDAITDALTEEIETVLEMDNNDKEIQLCFNADNPAPPIFNTTASKNDNEAVLLVECQSEISHDKNPSPEASHVMRLDEMIHRQSSRDLKKAFSLNDRFRYIREIFDNDAKYFDETINNLDLLSNLDEVYDYLLGDIGLNHEDENVKDFLAIIYNHFNA